MPPRCSSSWRLRMPDERWPRRARSLRQTIGALPGEHADGVELVEEALTRGRRRSGSVRNEGSRGVITISVTILSPALVRSAAGVLTEHQRVRGQEEEREDQAALQDGRSGLADGNSTSKWKRVPHPGRDSTSSVEPIACKRF